MTYTKPLEIKKCKLTDQLIFWYLPTTPEDPRLRVETLAGTQVIGSSVANTIRNGYFFWYFDVSTSLFSKQTNYVVKIIDANDSSLLERSVIYVTDDNDFEGHLDRLMGLSGLNQRKTDWSYLNGNPIGFTIKLYGTVAALNTAEAGGTDSPIATYTVTLTYDSQYRLTQIQSVRAS